MPQYEQSITLGNIDREKALAIVYSVLQNLNWKILSAGVDTLSGSVPRSWKTNGQQIVCTVSAGQLIVNSTMTHGEAADIFGTNKKNTGKVINAFEAIKNSIDDYTIENNKTSIEVLRVGTFKADEQQKAEAVELNSVMNFEGSNLYLTYSIIAINVLVFILMAVDGAGIFGTNPAVHIKWGSDYTPLTLSGDWWRLFTSTFIHFGIIHLGMNMYCLYIIGMYLEPMLGKLKFIAAYVCTGILASLVSIWWHTDPVNSAGASGAIFGMYGLFLALLTSSLIPKAARQQLLQSIGIFVVYNLAYGTKSGVDNAAHIGGLASGAVIGFIYIFTIKKERQQEQKLNWIVPVIVFITAGIVYSYLQQNKVDDSKRIAILNEIKESSYADNEKFNDQLREFDNTLTTVTAVINDTTLTSDEFVKKIDSTCLPQLKKLEQLISATTSYDISPASHEKAKKLIQYIGLRKDALEILKQMNEGNNSEKLVANLNDIKEKYEVLFDEIVKMGQ